MSSTKCSVDKLADEIISGLEEYRSLAATEVKAAVRKAGTTTKKQIELTAPKNTGKYVKSWTVTKQFENSNSLSLVVHSKTKYQLAHLLENGHAKRGGGRVKAQPHIAPAEALAIEQLEADIKKGLES